MYNANFLKPLVHGRTLINGFIAFSEKYLLMLKARVLESKGRPQMGGSGKATPRGLPGSFGKERVGISETGVVNSSSAKDVQSKSLTCYADV